MPTTPEHALPYPDDEEWLNAGAYAVEQLARRVDDVLADDAGLIVARSSTDQPATGATDVAFSGAVLRQEGWAFDGVNFSYAGPRRTFLIDVEVTMNAQGVGPSTTVEILANGASFAGSHDLVSTAPGDGSVIRRDVTHRITTPAHTGSSDITFTVVASGGTIDTAGLRIYPMGAHE